MKNFYIKIDDNIGYSSLDGGDIKKYTVEKSPPHVIRIVIGILEQLVDGGDLGDVTFHTNNKQFLQQYVAIYRNKSGYSSLGSDVNLIRRWQELSIFIEKMNIGFKPVSDNVVKERIPTPDNIDIFTLTSDQMGNVQCVTCVNYGCDEYQQQDREWKKCHYYKKGNINKKEKINRLYEQCLMRDFIVDKDEFKRDVLGSKKPSQRVKEVLGVLHENEIWLTKDELMQVTDKELLRHIYILCEHQLVLLYPEHLSDILQDEKDLPEMISYTQHRIKNDILIDYTNNKRYCNDIAVNIKHIPSGIVSYCPN